MSTESPPRDKKTTTAAQFLIRGLAITLPPILTIVILVWLAGAFHDYIIYPINTSVRFSIAQFIDDSRSTDDLVTLANAPDLEFCGKNFLITQSLRDDLRQRAELDPTLPAGAPARIGDDDLDRVYVPFGAYSVERKAHKYAVPYRDYRDVAVVDGQENLPRTVTGLYMELVTTRSHLSLWNLSVGALVMTILLLYFIGRIVTIRVGAWAVHRFETMFLGKLPVVSNVYSSVKQVTDFLFTERKIEYNRVVVLEYPRRGIWSLGFVTGESMLQITAIAGEPLVTVLIPTSPMPVTGYTMSVPRSEIVDLDVTIDQAFQFCISCGVLVPENQKITPELLQQEITKRLAEKVKGAGAGTFAPNADDESEETQQPSGEPS
ncbi:MAG: hypothetical protein CMJ48_14625 [Planctomycetaceae bacterium]|nr:hypothetical protein [Planctomycetaceae bacterium]